MKRYGRAVGTIIRSRALWIMVLLLGSVMLPGHQKAICAEVVDRIVAIVNDDIVSLSEINQLMVPYVEQIRRRGYSPDEERAALFRLRGEVLNQLIDQKLANQEITRNRISVGEKEIDGYIERLKTDNRLTDETFRAALKAQGMTYEEYREKMKEQILRTKLVNREIKSKIIITQDEIRSYYEAHPDEFKGSTKYRISYIRFQPPMFADEGLQDSIMQKMDSMRSELQSGKDFESVTAQYRQGIFSMEADELGTFSAAELSTDVFQMIEVLRQGQCTEIFKTDQGYQMFYLNELIMIPEKTLEEAVPQIQETLFREYLDKRFSSWIADLRQRSHIKVIQ